jgi:hypothetical protein
MAKRRPTRARRTRATTITQTRHTGLLTVSGQSVSPSTHLIKLKNSVEGGVQTHVLMEEGQKTLGEAV